MKKSQHSKLYKHLLQELKTCRKNADLTQVQAAEALGKHAPFISKIESGERRLDVIELAELCKIYDVKALSLLKKIGIE
ncbi:MAG: helix-turn-helix domain-containing protein [Bdellovibrio sp.]|nr:helix-turn-helix domain-containing protein [Bdellovibrio sp.]